MVSIGGVGGIDAEFVRWQGASICTGFGQSDTKSAHMSHGGNYEAKQIKQGK